MKSKVVFVLVLIGSMIAGGFFASFVWTSMNEMLGNTSLHEQAVILIGCVAIVIASPLAVLTSMDFRKKSFKSV